VKYDTTIRTRTIIERQTTCHITEIDWGYGFFDPEHVRCSSGTAEYKREHVENRILRLKAIEQALKNENAEVLATKDFSLALRPVLEIGMVSQWPYWTPRPCVYVSTWFSGEWYDWSELACVRVNGEVI
jgi:hypothetical protein